TTATRHSPVRVRGLSGATAVAAGGCDCTVVGEAVLNSGHSLALQADGSVWAWGSNDRGQLGDGTQDLLAHAAPARVPGLDGVVAIAAGAFDDLAVRSDGSAWVWGYHAYGPGSSTTPTRVAELGGVTALAAGDSTLPFGLALEGDGSVWAWGDNSS